MLLLVLPVNLLKLLPLGADLIVEDEARESEGDICRDVVGGHEVGDARHAALQLVVAQRLAQERHELHARVVTLQAHTRRDFTHYITQNCSLLYMYTYLSSTINCSELLRQLGSRECTAGCGYLVVELADELEVALVAVELARRRREEDAVPHLRHQQAHGHGELVLEQRLLQPRRRLLRVAHLRVLTALSQQQDALTLAATANWSQYRQATHSIHTFA